MPKFGANDYERQHCKVFNRTKSMYKNDFIKNTYDLSRLSIHWGFLIGSDREEVPDEPELDNPLYEQTPGEDDSPHY